MLGPSPEEKGGISAVVNTYLQLGIENKVDFKFIATYKDGNKLKKLLVFLKAMQELHKDILNCDIVHVHMAAYASFTRKSHVIEMAHKKGKRIIIHQHGGAFDVFYKDASPKEQERIRRIFSYASVVYVMSEEWKDFFTGNICDRDKVEVLHNGVVLPLLYDKDYDNHNILFLGRLEEKKGIYELIEALPGILDVIPDAQLYVGGYGEEQQLAEFADQQGVKLHIHFLGWIKGEEKDTLLRQCSVFVLPSYTEGMPVSVLEAMSYGLVPIASAVGGTPQIIEDNSMGILIEPQNISAITEAVLSVLDDEKRKQKIGSAARKQTESKFDATVNLNRVVSRYEELLELEPFNEIGQTGEVN